MASIKIRYKRLHEDLEPLQILDKGEWIDLRLAKDVHLSQGEFALLPLGIRVCLPHGFEAHIAPRSSTYKNFKIIQVNSPGVVDSSYCGKEDEWKMPVVALEATVIRKNTRVCQFRIVPSQKASARVKSLWNWSEGIELVEEEWLTGDEESRGGFGSTGEK